MAGGWGARTRAPAREREIEREEARERGRKREKRGAPWACCSHPDSSGRSGSSGSACPAKQSITRQPRGSYSNLAGQPHWSQASLFTAPPLQRHPPPAPWYQPIARPRPYFSLVLPTLLRYNSSNASQKFPVFHQTWVLEEAWTDSGATGCMRPCKSEGSEDGQAERIPRHNHPQLPMFCSRRF